MASHKKELPDCPTLYRNCEKATLEPTQGKVRGIIPPWLKGELVRVGPGIQKIGKDRYSHAFDGLSIIHKFEVVDGKAYYRSRVLESDTYKRNMEANRIVVSEYGTRAYPDPCQTLFGRLKTDFISLTTVVRKVMNCERIIQITDNCSVNMGYYGDQLYAMTESNCVRRIDPSTLETFAEKTKIDDFVPIIQATAHPHILADGTAINVGSSIRLSGGPHYGFIKVPPSFDSENTSFSNAKLIAQIPSRWKLNPGYFHSFGVTDTRKLVFIEQPFCIDLMGLAVGSVLNRAFNEFQTWYPKEKTRFYVVSMTDGEIHPVVYETDQLFVFHHINAYEEDGQIVVDVAGYNDAEWVKYATADVTGPQKLPDEASVRRYILPLNIESSKAGKNLVRTKTSATAKLCKEGMNVVALTPHHFTNEVFELPRINYKYNGKCYRYMYGVGYKIPEQSCAMSTDKLVKVDAETGEKLVWYDADEASCVSEPVFVADTTQPNAKEDEGVLLATLLPDDNPTEVSLVILDAKNMTEIGRVDFAAAGTVTNTYHGQWAHSGEKVHFY